MRNVIIRQNGEPCVGFGYRPHWAVYLVLLLVFGKAGLCQSLSADGAGPGSPIRIVQALYRDWAGNKPFPTNDREVLERYFDSELIKLLLEDAKCGHGQNVICGLDFDPIYDTQEHVDKNRKIKIRSLSQVPLPSVAVTLEHPARTLIYALHQTPTGWRISDIKYSDSRSLRNILSDKEYEAGEK
jgi:hypothetical protein